LKFSFPACAAEAASQALGDGAVAVTILSAPRQNKARVEILYNDEPDASGMSMKIAVLAAALNIPAPAFTLAPTPKLDWLKKVAADFPPLKIARWTIHGAQHRRKVPNRLFALQIDATNAFGTGEHPTTRGCLLMLDKILKTGFRPRRMADIGCGSGILAMACVQGARRRAVAVDLDADSALIAARNVRVNGFGKVIRAGRGNGYSAPPVRKSSPYDLIMANIFAVPLCRMAKDLKKNLKFGGVAVLSGLLTIQANKVIAAHRMQGLVLIGRKVIGEWSVLAFRRPNGAL
jgi:ribosomal protein L11 methyltransferase